ncbi:hypothetical protein [Cupriavidus basilensis]|uniref:hypothetical protein n=1 Tax=Cupriavidus basilensis TaxID=68895 RepID=UPI0039F6B079
MTHPSLTSPCPSHSYSPITNMTANQSSIPSPGNPSQLTDAQIMLIADKHGWAIKQTGRMEWLVCQTNTPANLIALARALRAAPPAPVSGGDDLDRFDPAISAPGMIPNNHGQYVRVTDIAPLLSALTRIAEMRDRDGNAIDMHREELRGIAKTALLAQSAPIINEGGSKPVATVRVKHGGYDMELSTHVSYAQPEGMHDLYAGPQPVAINEGGKGEGVAWSVTGATVRTLAAELIRAAESMGEESDELTLAVKRPGTVAGDDGALNQRHILAVSLAEYPEEGVYPVDPADPTGGRVDSASQPSAKALATIREKLARFAECADDDEDCDIGRNWFDALTTLGLLMRVGHTRWEMTDAGDALLAAEQPARQPDGGYPGCDACACAAGTCYINASILAEQSSEDKRVSLTGDEVRTIVRSQYGSSNAPQGSDYVRATVAYLNQRAAIAKGEA